MTTLFPILASADSSSGTKVLILGVVLLLLGFWYLATENLKRKRNIGSIITAAIIIFSILAVISPSNIGKVLSGKVGFGEASNLNGGIEIVGGTSVILQVEPNKDSQTGEEIPITPEAMQSAKNILEQRINTRGTLDAPVTIVGNRLEIQIPKLEPEVAEKLIDILTTSAKLTIHSVHRESRMLADGVANKIEIEPGYMALPHTEVNEKTKEEVITNVLIKRKEALSGKNVKSAYVDPRDVSIVNIELTGEGGDLMEEFTSTLTQDIDMIATVLDGKVVNYATLNAKTLGQRFVITGLGSKEEADELCRALQNPLENDILVKEKRSISASLGDATVKQGINAGVVGLLITAVFLIAYYRVAGLIALIGLIINLLILFGAMAAFEASFTLPGIAGIILTIGVGVDAYVLIYERIREELAIGKSLKAAISAAYEKAFSAIFDANLTTLIIALILFWQATGSIKGFAVTLTVGILGTMVAALLCSRVMLWWTTDLGMIKKLSFMNVIPEKIFDFLGMRKKAIALSVIVAVAGMICIGIKGTSNLGIDFVGGDITRFSIPAEQNIDQAELDKVISSVGLTKLHSTQIEEPEGSDKIITIKSDAADTKKIIEALRSAVPYLGEKKESVDENGKPQSIYVIQPNSETVSPAMGGEFLTNSIFALGLGLFLVMIYIAVQFEISFAFAAMIALVHDVIITLGLLYLVGNEISLIHVGAFLTIVGYSINDTIIIFDRIRESLKNKRGELMSVMNDAISLTLSRTIITSLTTFISVLVLYIYGGQALSDFSLTIMFGVVVGTYSSIFIASPIVFMITKNKGLQLRSDQLDANLEAEINPAGRK